jgi:hypothetical protein
MATTQVCGYASNWFFLERHYREERPRWLTIDASKERFGGCDGKFPTALQSCGAGRPDLWGMKKSCRLSWLQRGCAAVPVETCVCRPGPGKGSTRMTAAVERERLLPASS